ncbi:hypothetical protein DPMN_167236 [Dreissena polymorpha]|uniref:Uncharacterized protein n=1 Tax=Dreissena polymorpha TaxID=45954 RepID=A0A9D4F003_DREPO|nr:hypothetical protein DPMN_167141 [Dreissena polymorpha]KAH3789068.1 hypothetical protein DPMN_167236 [Dreissena polymorpha]
MALSMSSSCSVSTEIWAILQPSRDFKRNFTDLYVIRKSFVKRLFRPSRSLSADAFYNVGLVMLSINCAEAPATPVLLLEAIQLRGIVEIMV